MRKIEYFDCNPAGIDSTKQHTAFALLLILSFVISLLPWFSRFRYLNDVVSSTEQTVEIEMMRFEQLFCGAFFGFELLMLLPLALIIYNFVYHYQGSKSVYLMKRLPDGTEYIRRCITQPIMMALVCVGVTAALILIYYALYVHFVPDDKLPEENMKQIWRCLIYDRNY